MAPQQLIAAMVARENELANMELVHVHTEGKAPYVNKDMSETFFHNAFFVGANVREAVQAGRADYIPMFLSEMPRLFRDGSMPLDVALISVSPPDKHGYCSLGPSVDISLGAIESAQMIIAEVNSQAPRTHGDGVIHINDIDYHIEVDTPLHEAHWKPIGEDEQNIGRRIAGMIEDGSTLQMGIGNIPNAVLGELGNHKDLGIHTEMFSDGIIPLVEKGVITGAHKKILPHKIVASFAMGSNKLYQFMDDNPMITMKDAAYTNDTAIIRQNPKVIAINSAIEMDLTGQVCADTIGPKQFSGVGGQMDFIRGASLSEGGKPIFAFTAATKKGMSKIVPRLHEGAGVTTTRAHVHWVVTEHGAVNLHGKNLRQRAKALISIAAPEHREALEKAAYEQFGSL
jgi:acyl-CoA hydrolase